MRGSGYELSWSGALPGISGSGSKQSLVCVPQNRIYTVHHLRHIFQGKHKTGSACNRRHQDLRTRTMASRFGGYYSHAQDFQQRNTQRPPQPSYGVLQTCLPGVTNKSQKTSKGPLGQVTVVLIHVVLSLIHSTSLDALQPGTLPKINYAKSPAHHLCTRFKLQSNPCCYVKQGMSSAVFT